MKSLCAFSNALVLCLSAFTAYMQELHAQLPDDQNCSKITGPPIMSDMPDSFYELRLDYRTSVAAQQCRKAVERLRQRDPRSLKTLLSDSWLAKLRGVESDSDYDDYLENCTQKFSSGNASKFEKILQKAADRIAIFFRKTGREWTPFCAGFRLAGSNIVSAKHCVSEPDRWYPQVFARGQGQEELIEAAEIPLVSFENDRVIILGTPGKAFSFHLPNEKFKAFDKALSDDYLVLSIKGSQFNDISFPTTVMQKWDKLGFFIFSPENDAVEYLSNVLSGHLGTNVLETLTPDKFLRFDLSPNCYAWHIQNGCSFYNCQTLAGLSGSPVFSWDRRLKVGKKIKLGFGFSAVHNRGLSASDTCDSPCGFMRGYYIRNVGVLQKEDE